MCVCIGGGGGAEGAVGMAYQQGFKSRCFLRQGTLLHFLYSRPGVQMGTGDAVAGGGGVLPIMAYTGRLCLKGVPFSGVRFSKE